LPSGVIGWLEVVEQDIPVRRCLSLTWPWAAAVTPLSRVMGL
jgi:hypothetical protein